MRCGGFTGGPIGVQLRSISQINVQPTVVVIIKKSQPAAFRFDDIAFVIDAAPHIQRSQTGFLRYYAAAMIVCLSGVALYFLVSSS